MTTKLDEALPDLDVVYMLRIQRERLEGAPYPSLREYNMLYGLTKDREHLMKPDALICHPGPINRGVEFCVVPMVFRSLTIADELASSCIVRGIESPCAKQSYYAHGMRIGDGALMAGFAIASILIVVG